MRKGLECFAGCEPCRSDPQLGAGGVTGGHFAFQDGCQVVLETPAGITLRLPEDLVRYARDRLKALERSDVGSQWWVGAAAEVSPESICLCRGG